MSIVKAILFGIAATVAVIAVMPHHPDADNHAMTELSWAVAVGVLVAVATAIPN